MSSELKPLAQVFARENLTPLVCHLQRFRNSCADEYRAAEKEGRSRVPVRWPSNELWDKLEACVREQYQGRCEVRHKAIDIVERAAVQTLARITGGLTVRDEDLML